MDMEPLERYISFMLWATIIVCVAVGLLVGYAIWG